jgi:hypothetical protein
MGGAIAERDPKRPICGRPICNPGLRGSVHLASRGTCRGSREIFSLVCGTPEHFFDTTSTKRSPPSQVVAEWPHTGKEKRDRSLFTIDFRREPRHAALILNDKPGPTDGQLVSWHQERLGDAISLNKRATNGIKITNHQGAVGSLVNLTMVGISPRIVDADPGVRTSPDRHRQVVKRDDAFGLPRVGGYEFHSHLRRPSTPSRYAQATSIDTTPEILVQIGLHG